MFFERKEKSGRFRELTYPHLRSLYSIAFRLTGRSEDAEDLVQETMYNAFRSFHQLRDEGKLKSWLISILRNVYLREVGRNGRRWKEEVDGREDYIQRLGCAVEENDPELLFFKRAEAMELQKIIDRLPEKHRMPLILAYVEGLSYKEIADILEIPIGTVMSSIFRAKSFVKRDLLKLAKKVRDPKIVRLDIRR